MGEDEKRREKDELIVFLGLYNDLLFLLEGISDSTKRTENVVGSVIKRILQLDYVKIEEKDVNVKQLRNGLLAAIKHSNNRNEFLVNVRINLLKKEIEAIKKQLGEMGVPGYTP